MRVLLWSVLLFVCAGCRKVTDAADLKLPDLTGFTQYTINAGEHYATHNVFKPVQTQSLSFQVCFDRSAIYQTIAASNQDDINKLYGFSDNGAAHHLFSARIGWNWSQNELRLFAYVYNGGQVTSKVLGVVQPGTIVPCRISISKDQYLFQCGDYQTTLPRQSTTPQADGYLLYPYFGGDETATHEINIWIKDGE